MNGKQTPIDVQIAVRTFEGAPLTTYIINGAPTWLARDVGGLLGYEDDGRRVVANIGGRWAEDFIECEDFARVDGDVLAALKSVQAEVDAETAPTSEVDAIPARAPAITVLYESGVNLVCMLTRKPAGTRLRRWLARDVLPSLRETGSYSTPDVANDSPVWPEPEQPTAIGIREQLEFIREAVAAVGDRADPDIVAAWFAAGMRKMGLEVPALQQSTTTNGVRVARYAAESDDTELDTAAEQPALPFGAHPALIWYSATDIAQLDRSTPQGVGRIVSKLGLRDADRPDVRVRRVNIGERVVDKYEYRGDALRLIRAEVRGSHDRG